MGLFTRSSNATSEAQAKSVQAKFNTSLEGSNVACLNMDVEVDARADVMFTLLADPSKHAAIFASIEGASCKLIEESGPKRRYELDYLARWKFWRVSGLCENRLYMETDADQGTVYFKLREPGFLRVYEGTWRITPAGAAALNLHTRNSRQPLVPSHTQPNNSPAPRSGDLGGLASQMFASLANSPLFSRAPSGSGSPTTSSAVSVVSDPCTPADSSPPSPRYPWSGLFSGLGHSVLSSNLSAPGLPGVLASINNPLQQHPTPTRGRHHDAMPAPSHALPVADDDKSVSTSSGADNSSSNECSNSAWAMLLPSRTRVRVEGMRMSPKVSPPGPLAGLLKGNAVTQVEDMLHGLLAAAQQLQAEMPSPSPSPQGSSASSQAVSPSLSPSPSYNRLPTTGTTGGTPFAAASKQGPALRHCQSHRISFSVSDGEEEV